jgi:hypothetical protein
MRWGVYPCVPPSVHLHLHLCRSLSLPISVYLLDSKWLRLSVSVYLSVSLSTPITHLISSHLSLSLMLTLFSSVYLSVYLPLSLPLPHDNSDLLASYLSTHGELLHLELHLLVVWECFT